MAAYPNYPISLDSSQDLESGYDDDFDQSGVQHSRLFHAKQYYSFRIYHNILLSDYTALLATYAAGPRDVYTLTYYSESPQPTYSVKFTAPPAIKTNHGKLYVEVEVRLRGFKD